MFLDGERVVGAAFHRRVVADDHALAAGDAADADDQAGAGDFVLIQAVRDELADLEERRTGVEQAFYAVAGEELAARGVALAGLGVAA